MTEYYCEICFSPGATKSNWGEYLYSRCYSKIQSVKNNKPAGIG